MHISLSTVFWLSALLFGGTWLYVFLVAQYLALETDPDEIHFVKSADGVRLALHRYRPPGSSPTYREPVILCHGLAMNRFLFDFGGTPSLAHFLRARGFDVWVVEYRGSGMSSHPRLFDRRKANWNLDDTINCDVPTFIETVSRATGGASIHWIGHSTGAVVIFCHLGLNPEARVRSVVAMGAPGLFERMRRLYVFFQILRVFDHTRVLRVERLSRLVAALWITFYVWPVSAVVKALVNPTNLARDTLRQALVNLITNPLRPLLLQFGKWIRTGRALSANGKIDYYENLVHVKSPVFIVSGAADQGAPPDVGEWYFNSLSNSKTKERCVLSQKNGTKHDYGHGDLLLGRYAAQEVFPILERWLIDKSTPVNDPQQTQSHYQETIIEPTPRSST